VTCYIQSNGTLLNAAQSAACLVTSNTSLTPAGTSYRVDICPYMACSSSFNFYAINSTYDISAIVPTPTTGPAQNFADVFSNQVIAGNKTFTGVTTFAGTFGECQVAPGLYVNADCYAGGDLGAKINAADAILGATAGEIWVDGLSGYTITTPVVLSADHILRFVQGGTYMVSASITLGANSTLAGSTGAMAVNTTPSVVLKMANAVNLSSMVNMSGSFGVIQDIALDGNRANNSTAGPNLLVSAARAEISRVTVLNSNSDGVQFTSAASSSKIFKLMSTQNNGNGLNCVATGDGFVSDSEFENSVAANGILLTDCPGWRIEHNDFGENYLYGVVLTGTFSGAGSSNTLLTGNQFGNQIGASASGDLYINTFSFTDSIVGNQFIGSATYNGTQSEISILDSGNNVIVGNLFSSLPSNQALYAISATEGSPGVAGPNVISLNVLNGTFAGAIPYHSVQTVGGFGSQIPTSGLGTLDLFDVTASAPTPHKFFRVSAGSLQILSNSFANILLSLSDTGQLAVSGGVSTGAGLTLAAIVALGPVDGSMIWCTNCQVTTAASCSTATPASCICKNGGGGAFAKQMNYQGAGDGLYCQ